MDSTARQEEAGGYANDGGEATAALGPVQIEISERGRGEWSGERVGVGSRGRGVAPLSPPGAADERVRRRPRARSGAPEEQGRGAPGAGELGRQGGLGPGEKAGALSLFLMRFLIFCFLFSF